MAKDSTHGQDKTHLVGDAQGQRSQADMDDMVTNLRSIPSGRIVVVDGPGKGQSLQLYRGSNSIGREPGKNSVVLDFGDMKIHRNEHAFLTCMGSDVTLHDNGKTNPVKVNGRPIDGVVSIAPDDVIEIGSTRLKVELG